jgi:hypothetical protein
MLRGLRRRLDRLWEVHQHDKALREAARQREQAREKFAAILRAGLTRAGIDPATVPAMRYCGEPDPPSPTEPYRPPSARYLPRQDDAHP